MNDTLLNESAPVGTFRIIGSAPELFAALAKAQAAFEPVVKNRKVRVQTRDRGSYEFEYATLDVVIDAARPALNANGLALIQPFTADGDQCEVRTMLVHASGAAFELLYRFTKPESIQQLGSALTYIRRYSVASLLGVSSEEDDDGNAADGNQRETGKRGNPPAPKQERKTDVKPPAKAEEPPPPEPKTEPVVVDTTGTESVVDDVNGPDGEAVDDSLRPEFYDDSPMSEKTKTLVTTTMTKLLSVSGTGKDIPLPLRSGIVKTASGVDMQPGVKFSEGEGQRIVAFLYEVANGIQLDPDGPLSQTEVKVAIKAFEKRIGAQ